MFENKHKTLAIIPARGGSKGIYKKNIIDIFNKPLIFYSIKAAQESKFIDNVVVSSDDENILNIASTLKSNVIKRPKDIAADDSSINEVIKHILQNKSYSSVNYELLILLQPTSPLRTSQHIDLAFNEFFNSNAQSLISVYIPDKTPFKSFIKNKDGFLTGLVNDKTPFMNRQDLPEVFMPNGAIYIFKSKSFIHKNKIPLEKTIPFIMEKKLSFDIDTKDDIIKTEKIMKMNRKNYE